jgi:hypothetical protein
MFLLMRIRKRGKDSPTFFVPLPFPPMLKEEENEKNKPINLVFLPIFIFYATIIKNDFFLRLTVLLNSSDQGNRHVFVSV